jgi:hypothetical protein
VTRVLAECQSEWPWSRIHRPGRTVNLTGGALSLLWSLLFYSYRRVHNYFANRMFTNAR